MKKKKKKEKMVIYVGYSINEPRTLQFTLVENKTKRDYWQREDDNTMMMTTVAKKEKKKQIVTDLNDKRRLIRVKIHKICAPTMSFTFSFVDFSKQITNVYGF